MAARRRGHKAVPGAGILAGPGPPARRAAVVSLSSSLRRTIAQSAGDCQARKPGRSRLRSRPDQTAPARWPKPGGVRDITIRRGRWPAGPPARGRRRPGPGAIARRPGDHAIIGAQIRPRSARRPHEYEASHSCRGSGPLADRRRAGRAGCRQGRGRAGGQGGNLRQEPRAGPPVHAGPALGAVYVEASGDVAPIQQSLEGHGVPAPRGRTAYLAAWRAGRALLLLPDLPESLLASVTGACAPHLNRSPDRVRARTRARASGRTSGTGRGGLDREPPGRPNLIGALVHGARTFVGRRARQPGHRRLPGHLQAPLRGPAGRAAG